MGGVRENFAPTFPSNQTVFNNSLCAYAKHRSIARDEYVVFKALRSLKKVKNIMLLITDRCHAHASAAKP